MTSFDAMAYRTRALRLWAERVRKAKELPTFSVNRREGREPGSKTVALLLPECMRLRIEAQQLRWGCDSFARTAQVAMLIGLEMMEGCRQLPEPEPSEE